jgi:hypothetical protein
MSKITFLLNTNKNLDSDEQMKENEKMLNQLNQLDKILNAKFVRTITDNPNKKGSIDWTKIIIDISVVAIPTLSVWIKANYSKIAKIKVDKKTGNIEFETTGFSRDDVLKMLQTIKEKD